MILLPPAEPSAPPAGSVLLAGLKISATQDEDWDGGGMFPGKGIRPDSLEIGGPRAGKHEIRISSLKYLTMGIESLNLLGEGGKITDSEPTH